MGTKNYYFSSSASSEVKELTLTNLKKAFPDNHKFHDALDAEFKSDSELALYDTDPFAIGDIDLFDMVPTQKTLKQIFSYMSFMNGIDMKLFE